MKTKIMKKGAGLAGAVLLMAASNVGAVPIWNEVGDAGELPGTAQVVTLAGFNQIGGTIGSSTDADMFAFNITAPTTFSATTVGTDGGYAGRHAIVPVQC